MRLAGNDEARMGGLMTNLFSARTYALHNWVWLSDPDRIGIQPRNFTKPAIAPPLYYASIYGLQGVARQLLMDGADIDGRGGAYGSALQAASQGGHRDVVQLLVEKGADIGAAGGRWGTALIAASLRGHEGIVQLLLAYDADVHARGVLHSNALQAASISNHDGIIQLLAGYPGPLSAAVAPDSHLGSLGAAAPGSGYGVVARLIQGLSASMNAQGDHRAALPDGLGGHMPGSENYPAGRTGTHRTSGRPYICGAHWYR